MSNIERLEPNLMRRDLDEAEKGALLLSTAISARRCADALEQIAAHLTAPDQQEINAALVRTAPAETSGLITEQNKATSANAGEK